MKIASIKKIKESYKQIIRSGLLPRLLKARFFGIVNPIIASWRVTNRCNQSCLNCRLWEREIIEPTTSDVLSNIDKLFLRGIRFLVFTGGEPLLREDMGEIINYSFRKGIYTTLNTNGRLLEINKECLRKLNRLHLSLDGPEDINDYLRGKDSYKYTIEALMLAKNQKTPVCFTSVLCKHNLDLGNIDFLLNFAKKNKVKIGFQPASLNYLGSEQRNPLSPSAGEYKNTISYLIKCKCQGNSQIINSISGLRHMYNFPDEKKVFCIAKKLVLRIESDGQLLQCGWGIKKCAEIVSATYNSCAISFSSSTFSSGIF